jgi:hypothetical protein
MVSTGRLPLHKLPVFDPGNQIGQHARAPVYFGPLASFTESAPANFCLEAG